MDDFSPNRNPVEQLAEEWRQRLRQGEQPNLDEYTNRYPELADEIRDLFPAIALMEELKPAAANLTGAYSGDGTPGDGPAVQGKTLERLGDYRILREVGRGGMGIVYEAEQESLGRRVALKVLPSQALLGPHQQKRFLREAKATARLHHTNIVPVYGVGEQDGMYYYVMQFIQGLGLDEVLEELKRLRQNKKSVSAAPLTLARPAGADVEGEPDAGAVARSLLTGQFVLGGSPDSSNGSAVTAIHASPSNPAKPRLASSTDALKSDQVSVDSASSSSVHLPGQAEHATLSDSGRHYWHSVARIGVQVALALDYANSQGVVHRDVKPSNLLLDTQGTVWVTDFGLAKVTTEGDNLTHTGDIVGTLRYMAPERFRGHADACADIYSLGLTLYELLVFQPAYDESDPTRLIRQIAQTDPVAPRRLNSAIPRDLETIVLKAIEREPGRRYATAAGLAEDLQRFLDDKPVRARRVSAAERFWRWCRRNPALALATALAATGLLAVTLLSVAFSIDKARSASELEVALTNSRAQTVQTQKERDQKAKLASNLAQEQQRTKTALKESQELTARLTTEKKKTQKALDEAKLMTVKAAKLLMERGQFLIERGEAPLGMLWVARALEMAPADAAELQQAGRTNLAGMGQVLPVLRTALPHAHPVAAAAMSPDGTIVLTAAGEDNTARLWDASTGKPIGKPLRHGGPVTVAAFSPDGKIALTGGHDRMVRRWDPKTGQPLGKSLEHPNWVLCLAHSPDGRLIATGCLDHKVRLWKAATGEPVGQPLGQSVPLSQVRFSPDGSILMTYGSSSVVQLWKVATGKQIGVPLTHPGTVYRAGFSPDSKAVLTGCFDKKARLWDIATGKLRFPPLEHPEKVGPVAFSPDGKTVLTATSIGTAYLWDAATGKQVGQTLQHANVIQTVAYSPDGRAVLTASNDGTARLWDADTGRQIGQPLPHPAGLLSATFSRDGQTILTRTKDNLVRLWDLPTDRMVLPPLEHRDWIRALAFSPDGKTMATGSGDFRRHKRGEIRLFDTATGRPIGPRLVQASLIDALAFSPDGKRLATACVDKTARLWDAATGQPISPVMQHQGSVWAVAFSLDGTVLGTAGADKTVRLWDGRTGQPLGPVLLHNAQVPSLAFSPDGQTLATGSWDHTARLWNVRTGLPLGQPLRHKNRVQRVKFSPNGLTLLTGSSDGTAKLWDVRTGKLVRTFNHHGPVMRVDFSRNGTMVLTAGGKLVHLWETATGKPVGQSLQHAEGIYDAMFSPDGRLVLTASADRTARIWDVHTGQSLGPALTHPGRVWAAAFSPDGRLILTGGEDGTARLWTAPFTVQGEVPRLVRWVEVNCGLELTPEGTTRILPTAEWQKRQRELDTMGGPPALPLAPLNQRLGRHHRLAATYAAAGNWFAADWHLGQLMTAQPGDWFPHALASRNLVRAGRLDRAAQECARAVERGLLATVRDWFSQQAPEFHSELSQQTAVWYLDQLIRLRPKDGLAYVMRARARFLLGKPDAAAADFRKAVELGPRDQVLTRFRDYLLEYETQEQWQAGLWYVNRLIQAEPTDALLRARRGNLHGRLERLDLAQREYEQATRLGSTQWSHWDAHAVLCLWLGDEHGYRRTCIHLLRHFGQGTDKVAANGAAWVCTQGPGALADPLVPVEIMERLVAASPENGHYLQTLARALYRAGRYHEALARLEATQKLGPTDGTLSLWLFLAMTHHHLGHAGEARTFLDKAIQWLEESTPAKPKDNSLGVPVSWPRWLLAQVQRTEAEALIRGSPATANLKVRTAFARAHVRLGQWQQAVADFTKVLAAQPKDAVLRVERGRCLVQLRQWDKAVADFTAALADQPDQPGLLLERGLCYRELKQTGQAGADFARALGLRKAAVADHRRRFAAAPQVTEYRAALAAALGDLAELLRATGQPAKALTTLEEQRRLWPGHPSRLFDIARRFGRCVSEFADPNKDHAVVADGGRRAAAEQAMATLTNAIVAGYPVSAALGRDPAFASLRARADFQGLVAAADPKNKFKLPTGLIRRFAGHTNAWVEAVVFSADGRQALSGGQDHFVRLWDVATGKEVRRFTGHRAPVFGVVLLPGGRQAVSSSSDGTVRLWDVTTGKELQRIEADSGWDQHLAVSPDGRRLLFGSNDGRLHLWDIPAWKSIRIFQGTTPHLTCMAFSPNGKRALSGGQSQTLSLWDVDTGKEIGRFAALPSGGSQTDAPGGRVEGPAATVWSVAFSPDGRQVASGHADGFVRLWDVASRREVCRFEGHWDPVRTVVFAPGGRVLISGAHNGKVIVWEKTTGREKYRFASAPGTAQVSVSPDGRRLLAANSDTFVSLWLLSEEAARARRSSLLGQPAQAEQAYAQAIARRPNEMDVRVERGRCLARQGKWQQAAADLGKGLETNPEDKDLRLERGRCWARLARWDRTAEDFAYVIAKLPENAHWFSERSRVCQELAQWAQAFEKVTKMRPEDGHLQICRGRYLASLGRWQQARAAYAPVIATRPLAKSEEPFEYACLLLLTNDTDGYRRFCRATASRAGAKPDAFTAFVLARMCGLASGALTDPQQAVKWGEKAIASQKANYNLHALGAALVRAGKDQLALGRLRESLALNWGSATVVNWLMEAIACQHLDQDEFARIWLDRATGWFARVPRAQPGEPMTAVHVLDWLEANVLLREANKLIITGRTGRRPARPHKAD